MSTNVENIVSGLNNYITDLLDTMELLTADALVLPIGYYPMFYKENQSFQKKDDKIDKEEILEDLAALGLKDLSIPVVFTYKPDTGSYSEITFRVHTKIAASYSGIVFNIIAQKER